MRKPIIAGNWKMHNNSEQSKELIKGIRNKVDELELDKLPEIVVAPVFTSLYAVNEEICHCGCGRIKLAAQNVYFEPKGAFTGEISIDMLKDFSVSYIIIGHSERRNILNESFELIHKKVKICLENNIIPILCIGEKKEEINQKEEILTAELKSAFDDIGDDRKNIVIAYEPIWSIGTGLVPTKEEIEETLSWIKKYIKDNYQVDCKTLYGGSVNEENISNLKEIQSIDGYLIGGASLKLNKLKQMIDILEV